MLDSNDSIEPGWRLESGSGPIVATAIHDGHAVREEIAGLLALDDAQRLREEDPFTAEWTSLASNRVAGLVSRFQVDLNRPREKAVYVVPEDAWGLDVWRHRPTEQMIARSLDEYDGFYRDMKSYLDRIVEENGQFVVYDLHTYNYRRDGAEAPPADPVANPQVNIGTGTMDRDRWASVVDRMIDDLRAYDFPGGALDVRENIKFKGGEFSRWINDTYSGVGCAVAIEFTKFFMDEWTGVPDRSMVTAIGDALTSTVPGVLEALDSE